MVTRPIQRQFENQHSVFSRVKLLAHDFQSPCSGGKILYAASANLRGSNIERSTRAGIERSDEDVKSNARTILYRIPCQW